MKKKAFLFQLILLFFWASVAQAYVAIDPSRQVPDARVLGLGKAYIGLAEGTAAMYTNPAGLAEATGWEITSMSGKFLDEYSYLSFSGYYPTDFGNLGLAYAGTSISGAYATTIEAGSDPSDPVYVIDPTQPAMGNNNDVFIVSYGNRLDKIKFLNRLPFAERISLGTSLKLYYASMYGDGIVNGNASGRDMDFGLKIYPPQQWMTLGVTMQNLLPESLGGKLTYATGHTETYPAVFEVGSAFNILGKKNSLFTYGPHEVKLMVDFDMHPTLSKYPMLWHIGTEWKPVDLLAVRVSIDQDVSGDGGGGVTTVSDIAGGIGIYLGGFRFDYAYHTFAGAPNLDNHYFSLTYSAQIPKLPAPTIKPIEIQSPQDKLITFEGQVEIKGKIVDPLAQKLILNSAPAKFGLRGDFLLLADLQIGKNSISLEAKNAQGMVLGKDKLRVLRLMTFPDVEKNYWAAQSISLLAMGKIISGYPDGSSRPEGKITRAEMCALLMKAKNLSATSEGRVQIKGKLFKDVPANNWAARYIAQAVQANVVKGYPKNIFKPNGKISRGEAVTMIARFAGISPEEYVDQFPDLAPIHWASGVVAGAYRAGLLDYLKGKNFEVNRSLTRAEAAEMLSHTGYVQGMLDKDLLNWDSY